MHIAKNIARKCAKFHIDWRGISVLNIDYKICSRQTNKQEEVNLKMTLL